MALPKELSVKWNRWCSSLQHIDNFQIPMCYVSDFRKAAAADLHQFADASVSADGIAFKPVVMIERHSTLRESVKVIGTVIGAVVRFR